MNGVAAIGRRLSSASPRLVLALLLAGGAILANELTQGWYPHDEGALGQSAERILGGEHPHRDFDEIYTGLLSYFHAAFFAVSGPSSWVIRIPLFAAAIAWLWGMYRILVRFAPPPGAALVALAAFVWSVPNYPAPIPSWYLLFAATFGALALVRWHETHDRRWLVLAGAMGAVAFLLKLSGLLFLLGGALALIAAEDRSHDESTPGTLRPGGGAFALGITLILGATIAALDWVVGRGGDREFLRFALPITIISFAVVRGLWRPTTLTPRERMSGLVGRAAPFAIGAAVPVALFVLLFALLGGLPDLIDGVFVTPFRRVAFAAERPPSIVSLLLALPVAIALLAKSTAGRRQVVMAALTLLVAGMVIVFAAGDGRAYRFGWFSAWGLLFVAAVAGARLSNTPAPEGGAPAARAAAITLACLAVAVALVEYPFAAPIYTLYALPLTIVAVAAAVRIAAPAAGWMQGAITVAFLAFGLARIIPGTPNNLGIVHATTTEIAPLELERGGLRIDPREAVIYEELVRFVHEVAQGESIWAGPDSPELYFLSGIPNRTRTLFDFLDAPAVSTQPLVQRLDAIAARVVVVKERPLFSRALTEAQLDTLRASFPRQRNLPGFLVLWR